MKQRLTGPISLNVSSNWFYIFFQKKNIIKTYLTNEQTHERRRTEEITNTWELEKE